MTRSIFTPAFTAVATAALLAGCGGGSSGTTPPPVATDGPQVCSPNNPYKGDAGGQYVNGVWRTQPYTTGSLTTEKAWVKSYMDAAYLWYNQMPVVDPSLPAYSNEADVGGSLSNYFQALKTTATTPTGKRLDEFSFIYPTKLWADLISSGVSAENGIQWLMGSSTPPRNLRVAYVEPGSPAAAAGVVRGDVLVSVNGYSADDNTSAGVDALNRAIFGPTLGQTDSFVFARAGIVQPAVSLTTVSLTANPVPTVKVDVVNGKRIGYILFQSHTAASEAGLISAISTLSAQGIDDLVLDLRYNGGGYLYVASEMAYMIAGPARTAGKTFEKLQYNDKRTADNAQSGTIFYNTSTTNAALPTLNLGRVTVLTTDNTCSASEAIINGLRGVDVTVNVVGSTTCGKPYGFTAKDNCGMSYFPIEFKGVNNKGFGDYADGFAPTCTVADDLSQPLGSTAEGQYATALGYLVNGNCAPLVARAQPQSASLLNVGGRIVRGPERENRILGPAR